ncbi:hypothetical protein F01_480137 [Burkholderia cenocepacia]|nr:hypothetical protein F01_480137 [Burkholderia cenocepacia]
MLSDPKTERTEPAVKLTEGYRPRLRSTTVCNENRVSARVDNLDRPELRDDQGCSGVCVTMVRNRPDRPHQGIPGSVFEQTY